MVKVFLFLVLILLVTVFFSVNGKYKMQLNLLFSGEKELQSVLVIAVSFLSGAFLTFFLVIYVKLSRSLRKSRKEKQKKAKTDALSLKDQYYAKK